MQLNTAKRASFDEGSLDQYLREISQYPLITREEEVTLAQRIKQSDPEALDKLVRSNLRVALLDPLRQRDLFLTGDQRILTDLPQVLIERSLVERGSFRRVELHGRVTSRRARRRRTGLRALVAGFLPDDRPEPVPANIGQPRKRVPRLPVVAEIHDERPSLDGGRVHEPPVPGIRGVVSVVAQHEVLAGRDGQRTPGVPGRVIVADHARAAE